jgi:hypothetical protein
VSQVRDLMPGDLVSQGEMSAVYVAQCEHPIWPRMRLVIWKLDDGRWSHDALAFYQDVGAVTVSTDEERRERLRLALLAPPREWQGGLGR